MSLPVLLLYFLVAAAPIVLVTTFLAYADDATAFRSYPGRLFSFLLACGLLVAVILLVERIFLP